MVEIDAREYKDLIKFQVLSEQMQNQLDYIEKILSKKAFEEIYNSKWRREQILKDETYFDEEIIKQFVEYGFCDIERIEQLKQKLIKKIKLEEKAKKEEIKEVNE